jgi:hypothetical protein
VQPTPSTTTAFIAKVRAPPRRGSARYRASDVADRVAGDAGRGIDVGIEQRVHGLTSLSRTGPRGGEDDLVELVLAVRVDAAETRLGRKRAIVTGAAPLAARRRLTSASDAADATSSGKPSWNACVASIAPVHLRSARRGASGSNRRGEAGGRGNR